MRFLTIPDEMNVPIMINLDKIETITPMAEDEILIQMTSGHTVLTKIPREILVDMIGKASKQERVPVETQTEWAG